MAPFSLDANQVMFCLGRNSVLGRLNFVHRPCTRHVSYDHLKESLPRRQQEVIFDDLVPGQSHKLNVSLSSFLPQGWLPENIEGHLPEVLSTGRGNVHFLPPAHHLVYFNQVLPAEKLLPDGTDPLQSPGPPFVRRMWAGGYLRFNAGPLQQIPMDGLRWACVEGIRDVSITGPEGQEKVYVGIERRIGKIEGPYDQESVRSFLWRAEEEDFGNAYLIERRNIVFMHERTKEELWASREAASTKLAGKSTKPRGEPTFEHTLTPTASLLFRYSALTFNAHAIHLDPQYCRTIEGHRDLLCHGPLLLTLLTTMIQHRIKTANPNQGIRSIIYRNAAPMYVSESIRLCGREQGNGKYSLWAETPEGRIAVKATATTQPVTE